MKWQLFFFLNFTVFIGYNAMSQVNNEMQKENIAELNYFDGSGNKYRITSDEIEYLPVSEMNSSSGNYSGGEKKNSIISGREFLEIIKRFDYLFDKSEIHLENRIKTSGMIRYIFKNSKRKTRIIRKSKELDELEILLNSMLHKNNSKR